jgi:hypothetical protein
VHEQRGRSHTAKEDGHGPGHYAAGPFTQLDGETPRRQAVRTLGAAGAALLGAMGMSAQSTETRAKGKNKQVASEKKGKKWKKGKRGPAGPAGPQDPPGPNDNTLYWARVDSNGTFIAGHGFVRAHNIGGKTGQYSVSIDGEEAFASWAWRTAEIDLTWGPPA